MEGQQIKIKNRSNGKIKSERNLQKPPFPCRSWLASEGFECATFILLKRVTVNDLREQARSHI
jgi:hypothetical protein